MALALVGFCGQSIKDDELVPIVLVNLWPLTAAQCVFKGKRMKPKLLANGGDLVGSWIDNIDPDRGLLLSDELTQFLDAVLATGPLGPECTTT